MKTVNRFYAELAALFIFIVYLTTMASTVIHLDAGELAAVQSTLGIAHPTGYPLFSIIGFLFTKILFPFRQIDVLNLLAAVYCTLAVWIFIKLTYLLTDKFTFHPANKKKVTSLSFGEDQKKTAAVTTGLIVGLGRTFWFQSTSVEVYSLHLFLMSLIIYFTVAAYHSNKSKHWYYTAVFIALGFANHMTTILLVPGIAFLFFKQNGFNKSSLTLILKMLFIFFPILILLYAYLPLRAMQNPSINWGNPVDLEKFMRHVSGAQYQVWIFSSVEAAKKQFVSFVNSLPSELGYIGLIISLIGIPILFKHSKIFFVFLIINFIAAVSYSINYDIADIDSYFLLAYISLALFSISSISVFIQKAKKHFKLAVFVIPLAMLFVNYGSVNKSDIYAFEDYTKSILDKAEENSIVFSYLWDYFISPSYYFQHVENYRSDVAIIDKELLRRSWYYKQLEKNMPDVMGNIKPQIKEFLKAVKPFEKGEPFDSKFIEMKYRQLMTALVSENINERDFYLTPELFENEMQKGEFQLPAGYTIVPLELFFKVVKYNAGYIPADFSNVHVRFGDSPDYYENNINNFLSSMMVYRIMYELQFGNVDKAKYLFNRVRTENPDYRIPPDLVIQLQE